MTHGLIPWGADPDVKSDVICRACFKPIEGFMLVWKSTLTGREHEYHTNCAPSLAQEDLDG